MAVDCAFGRGGGVTCYYAVCNNLRSHHRWEKVSFKSRRRTDLVEELCAFPPASSLMLINSAQTTSKPSQVFSPAGYTHDSGLHSSCCCFVLFVCLLVCLPPPCVMVTGFCCSTVIVAVNSFFFLGPCLSTFLFPVPHKPQCMKSKSEK